MSQKKLIKEIKKGKFDQKPIWVKIVEKEIEEYYETLEKYGRIGGDGYPTLLGITKGMELVLKRYKENK